VTFHQSYSYEEFILGKRPVSSPRGLEIEPHLGLLMTLAVELDMPAAPDGCVLIIDEINRANASQVFGEFITLLDPDYRRSVNGTANPSAVSPRLPGLRYSGGVSEPVAMLRGVGYVALREDWTFPEHVYVVATMNSVDKAALPLDSALSRRFFRMSMPPDLLVLASSLGLTWPAVEAAGKAARVPGGNVGGLSAEITTVLLLERLNYVIATDLGEDFELGHGLLWEVVRAGSSARWQALAAAWDTVLLPQLIERFAGRADALRRVLKVGEATGSGSVIVDRHLIGAAAEPDSPLFMPALVGASVNDVQATLRFLAI
jgi:5-methylcytosine-specific restriction protein B